MSLELMGTNGFSIGSSGRAAGMPGIQACYLALVPVSSLLTDVMLVFLKNLISSLLIALSCDIYV